MSLECSQEESLLTYETKVVIHICLSSTQLRYFNVIIFLNHKIYRYCQISLRKSILSYIVLMNLDFFFISGEN